MSPITFPNSNIPGNFPIDGSNGAGSPDGPSKAGGQQPPVVPPETNGKEKVGDRGFTPDAPGGNVDMSALRGMFVATLSPGAVLAALCVKEAAKQNEQNTTELFKRSEAVQKTMMDQAKKIEDAAFDKMCLAIAGAVASAAMSIGGSVVAAKGVGMQGDQLAANRAKTEAIQGSGQSISGIFNAIGGFVESKAQAEVKRMDAKIEQNRTVMEALKNSMQAQRDLMSKSLEFMSSMQANMNQTMGRIMG